MGARRKRSKHIHRYWMQKATTEVDRATCVWQDTLHDNRLTKRKYRTKKHRNLLKFTCFATNSIQNAKVTQLAYATRGGNDMPVFAHTAKFPCRQKTTLGLVQQRRAFRRIMPEWEGINQSMLVDLLMARRPFSR